MVEHLVYQDKVNKTNTMMQKNITLLDKISNKKFKNNIHLQESDNITDLQIHSELPIQSKIKKRKRNPNILAFWIDQTRTQKPYQNELDNENNWYRAKIIDDNVNPDNTILIQWEGYPTSSDKWPIEFTKERPSDDSTYKNLPNNSMITRSQTAQAKRVLRPRPSQPSQLLQKSPRKKPRVKPRVPLIPVGTKVEALWINNKNTLPTQNEVDDPTNWYTATITNDSNSIKSLPGDMQITWDGGITQNWPAKYIKIYNKRSSSKKRITRQTKTQMKLLERINYLSSEIKKSGSKKLRKIFQERLDRAKELYKTL